MKIKQRNPSRYVEYGCASPSQIPSPIGDDFASITSNMVKVSFPSSCVSGPTTCISLPNKKRNEDETTISNIPQSIMYTIFLRIPAQALRCMTKYVCKDWNDIISLPNFITQHSTLNESDGFLVQKFLNDVNHLDLSYFVEIDNETNAVTIHPSKQVFETVLATSTGLFLTKDHTPASHFSVFEPLSGNKLYLPPSPMTGVRPLFCGFAQDPNSGKYKVVHFYSDKPYVNFCFMLPLGVESKWRRLNVGCFGTTYSLNRITISAGRYIYSVISENDCRFDISIFDAQTESIHHCDTTIPSWIFGCPYYFLPVEDSLSLVVPRKNNKWKAWTLTNFHGDWEPICNIDLSSLTPLIEREMVKDGVLIKPWMMKGGLIIFSLTYPSLCRIGYDVRKEDFFWFELPHEKYAGKLSHFHVKCIFSLNWS